MGGEDLSVFFDGREPPPRPHFTSCYDDYVLAGDLDWFLLSDSEGMRKRLRQEVRPAGADRRGGPASEIVDRLWRVLEDEAGGTLPQFAPSGAKAVIGVISRRSLLRRGGIGAAGAGLSASARFQPPRRAAGRPRRFTQRRARRAAARAPDHVDAFEGGSPADTPNLDDLSGDSLRFDRTVPESMPGLSARRALITGMRAYPFRDWRRTDGLAPVPGFTPIWDHQPVLTETLREHGVTTAYVSDNPTDRAALAGREDDRGTLRSPSTGQPGIESELLPAIARQTKAAARTFRAGIRELGLAEAPVFLAIDPFDPLDAAVAPRS